MIKMLEIKTCTAFWEIDGSIMRFQRRKKVGDEQTGKKIAQYKEILLTNTYEKEPEKLIEIHDFLDSVILVRIGLEIFHDDFLRMFRHYSRYYINLWVQTNKVVRAMKISIFPVFELMFTGQMVDTKDSYAALLKYIDCDKIFIDIFEEEFSRFWINKVHELMSNNENLITIKEKIGTMRTTRYLMSLPENMVTEYLEAIAGAFTVRRELITNQKFHEELFGSKADTTTAHYYSKFVDISATVVKKEFEVQIEKFILENHEELDVDKDKWVVYKRYGPSLSFSTIDFSAINSPSLKLEIKYFMKHRLFSLTCDRDGVISNLIYAVNMFTSNNPNIYSFADIDDVDVKALHIHLENKYTQNNEAKSMSGIIRIFSDLNTITKYLMSDWRDENIKSPRPYQNPFSKYQFFNAREYKVRTLAIPEIVIDQIDLYIDELNKISKLIYSIFRDTGMRTKEVLFLEADCLEKSKYDNIVQIKYKPYKVLSARRKAHIGDYHRVFITQELADEIKNQIEETAEWRKTYDLPYIFINKRPNFRANMLSMQNFNFHVNALIKKHNIHDESCEFWHFTSRQHRKTLAVTLIENGATIEELVYWLGHLSRTAATNYYAEVRKMKLVQLNTKFFKEKFDLILSEEQLSEYSEEERKLLYIDFRLEERKVEFGYCLKKLADGGCTSRNSMYNCVGCKNLCTGKQYFPYWRELFLEQKLVVSELLDIYAKCMITDFTEFKEYKHEIFLLTCYENIIKSLEDGVE